MPINYNIPSPAGAVAQGLQIGGSLNQARQQNIASEQSRAAQKAMQEDLSLVLDKTNPTAADYAALTVKYPQMNEQFEQAWGMLSEERKNNSISQVSEVYAALEAGSPEVAKQLLETQAMAAENSDDPRAAKGARTLINMIDISPDTAKTSSALRLSSMMGADKFTETFTKLEANRRSTQLEESDLTEAESKAFKAAVGADFAESNAAADLQKKGWDITKIQNDIAVSKDNQKISALNAQLNREGNQLKRDQMSLKMEEMKRARDAAVNEKSANVESSRGNIDNMMNSLDRVLQTPLGTIESATGPISSVLPTLSEDTADFEELISTIDSQAFLAQIPNMTGLGALSDSEGKKLSSALQNFSLRQSPERLLANVREAQRLLLKARENLSVKYGIPNTIPDTPASAPSPEEIDQLLQQYGVHGGLK